MFDGQAETSRAAGSEVQPVCAAWEEFVGKRVGERFVIDAEVFVRDAGISGFAGGSAGLEGEDRFIGVGLWDPAPHRSSTEPLVLEKPKLIEIFISMDVA